MDENRTEFVSIGTVLVCWAMTMSAYNTLLGNVMDAFGALDAIMRNGSTNKYFIQATLTALISAVHIFKYSRSSTKVMVNDTASFFSDNDVLSLISYVVATMAMAGYAQGVTVDGRSTKRFYAWEYFTIPRERVRMALMLENVEKVLDELRPFLMADGGNVEVVELDGPIVKVRLQGACGSCPSSTMTLKMGIERKMRESIPEVSEVVQVL